MTDAKKKQVNIENFAFVNYKELSPIMIDKKVISSSMSVSMFGYHLPHP